MLNVLVCWSVIPEDTFFVSLKMTLEEAELLNGAYVNNNADEEEKKLINKYFYGNCWGKFQPQRIDTPINAKDYDLVIHCGFCI